MGWNKFWKNILVLTFLIFVFIIFDDRLKSKTYLVDQGYKNINGMLQKWFQHSVSTSFMSFTTNFVKQICFAEQKGKQKKMQDFLEVKLKSQTSCFVIDE